METLRHLLQGIDGDARVTIELSPYLIRRLKAKDVEKRYPEYLDTIVNGVTTDEGGELIISLVTKKQE